MIKTNYIKNSGIEWLVEGEGDEVLYRAKGEVNDVWLHFNEDGEPVVLVDSSADEVPALMLKHQPQTAHELELLCHLLGVDGAKETYHEKISVFDVDPTVKNTEDEYICSFCMKSANPVSTKYNFYFVLQHGYDCNWALNSIGKYKRVKYLSESTDQRIVHEITLEDSQDYKSEIVFSDDQVLEKVDDGFIFFKNLGQNCFLMVKPVEMQRQETKSVRIYGAGITGGG